MNKKLLNFLLAGWIAVTAILPVSMLAETNVSGSFTTKVAAGDSDVQFINTTSDDSMTVNTHMTIRYSGNEYRIYSLDQPQPGNFELETREVRDDIASGDINKILAFTQKYNVDELGEMAGTASFSSSEYNTVIQRAIWNTVAPNTREYRIRPDLSPMPTKIAKGVQAVERVINSKSSSDEIFEQPAMEIDTSMAGTKKNELGTFYGPYQLKSNRKLNASFVISEEGVSVTSDQLGNELSAIATNKTFYVQVKPGRTYYGLRLNLSADTKGISYVWMNDKLNPTHVFVTSLPYTKTLKSSITVGDVNVRGQIKIIKVGPTGSPVESAQFAIKSDDSGDIVDRVTTDALGVGLSKQLPSGIYFVKEERIIPNLTLDPKEYRVEIRRNGEIQTINSSSDIITNSVTIKSVDASNNDAVPNCTYRITRTSSNAFIKDITTNAIGEAKIQLPDGQYTVREINTNPNYQFTTSGQEFTVLNGNTTPTIEFRKKLIGSRIIITARDYRGFPITARSFDVMIDNHVITTITTNRDGSVVLGLPEGAYKIKDVVTGETKSAQLSSIHDMVTLNFSFSNGSTNEYPENPYPNIPARPVSPMFSEINLKLIDDDTREPVEDLRVKLVDDDRNTIETGKTDRHGKVRFDRLDNNKEYELNIMDDDEYELHHRMYFSTGLEERKVKVEKVIDNKRKYDFNKQDFPVNRNDPIGLVTPIGSSQPISSQYSGVMSSTPIGSTAPIGYVQPLTQYKNEEGITKIVAKPKVKSSIIKSTKHARSRKTGVADTNLSILYMLNLLALVYVLKRRCINED